MAQKKRVFWDLLFIMIGCALYAFGLVFVNIANHLAEGGITGVTLLIRFWWHIDPAYSTLALNVPLLVIGYKFLGKKAMLYTIYGTLSLSLWLWIWQRCPWITIPLHHDLFIAGVLAGLFGGLGSGLVYRNGGTTGGTDVIARIFESQFGIPMGQTLLVFDTIVLTVSLTYLNLELMMYTLLAAYVFSRIVNVTLDGTYAAKGLLIISDQSQAIAQAIMAQLERGATFLHAEGAFVHNQKEVLYVVVSPSEIAQTKRLIDAIDDHAFISIFDVHEALGEGFSYQKKKRRLLFGH